MSVTVDIVDQVVSVYDGATKYYGAFYDEQDQDNAGITAVNKVKLRTTDLSNGVTVASQTRITIANPGVYNIAFSAQFSKSDGGDDKVELWLCKNGNNMAWTNTEVILAGNGAKSVAAWNFFVNAASGDFYELCWHSPDLAVSIQSTAAASNPTRPAVPSVILTVNQVS